MKLFVIGLIVAVAAAAVVAIVVIPRDDDLATTSTSESELTGFSDRYQPYSEQALAEASADEKVVLFFSAVWCSTCTALRDDIAANQQSIPEGVLVLLVDFDDSTALKQQYGVVYQHTLVQVDRTGLGIARWELSRSLDELLATIVEV